MELRKKKPETTTRNTRDQSQRHAPVFSYYSNRSQSLNDSSARTTDRLKPSTPSVKLSSASWWVRYMPSLLSLGIVILAGLYTTTLSIHPKLNVAADDNKTAVLLRETSAYQDAAEELFSESVFNQSKLTLDTDRIASQLEAQFPELGEVIVTVPLFGRKPIIEAQPASPTLLLAAKNGVYVIDTNGIAVLRANDLNSSVRDKLPVVNDITDTSIELGKQAMPTDTVNFIALLGHQFTEKRIRTETYTLPAIANEVHLKPANQPYIVKFNTELDPAIQAGGYFALKQMLEGEGKQASEYIDVRVEGRVFYK